MHTRQTKMGGIAGIPTILTAVWLSMGIVAPAGAVTVTGAGTTNAPTGTVVGFGGDYPYSTLYRFYDNDHNSNVQMRLDLGAAVKVDQILNVNQTDVATKLDAKDASIYVAADESAGGFDPSLASNFTVLVFSGPFLPAVYTAAAVRSADITDVKRRYFRIDYTSNFWGPISTTNVNLVEVRVSDLRIVRPPPEETVVVIR